jgi:hypothetical protein
VAGKIGGAGSKSIRAMSLGNRILTAITNIVATIKFIT